MFCRRFGGKAALALLSVILLARSFHGNARTSNTAAATCVERESALEELGGAAEEREREREWEGKERERGTQGGAAESARVGKRGREGEGEGRRRAAEGR